MTRDWITVFEALRSVYIEGAYSNIAINEAAEHHKGCSVGFVRAFTKGVIRDSIQLDWFIDKLAKKGIKSIKKKTLIILRMGIYAVNKLDSVPDHAAVNSSVNLAKKVSRGSEGFVNGMLRDYLRRKDTLFADIDGNIALMYSFPQKLVDMISEQYGEEAESILKALSEPAPLVIRANTVKTGREELIEVLQTTGINAYADDESRNGIICEGGSIISSEAFRNGLFSVQSLSSILAIEALDPQAGERILDMCAAPGGKSCAMAELMQDKGEITACDIYEHRLELIKASADRLGLKSIETRLLDGTEHCAEFENSFDRVLADVPCSGLGVIQGKPEIKLKEDSFDFKELENIQAGILKNAISYTVPGGIIEYSTCTINREENEMLVNRVLEECSLVQILEMKTLLPYNNKVGFFYCIMKKSH